MTWANPEKPEDIPQAWWDAAQAVFGPPNSYDLTCPHPKVRFAKALVAAADGAPPETVADIVLRLKASA